MSVCYFVPGATQPGDVDLNPTPPPHRAKLPCPSSNRSFSRNCLLYAYVLVIVRARLSKAVPTVVARFVSRLFSSQGEGVQDTLSGGRGGGWGGGRGGGGGLGSALPAWSPSSFLQKVCRGLLVHGLCMRRVDFPVLLSHA